MKIYAFLSTDKMFLRRYSLGVHDIISENTRLKLRMLPNPQLKPISLTASDVLDSIVIAF